MLKSKRWLIISILALVTSLAIGCGSPSTGNVAEQNQGLDTPISPSDTPIAPPSPTESPIAPPPPPPTASSTASPIAPPPPSETAWPTPTPRKEHCQEPVYGEFQSIHGVDWSTLSCPSAGPSVNVMMAKEGFEGGQMIWREDNRQIYVRYNSGSWRSFPDSWGEGQPEFSCPDIGTQNPPVPVRGFGKVWCEHSDVRNQLGRAKNKEQGFRGSIQDFLTGGHIIRMDTGKVYVLYPTGDWVKR